ncbi:MAG: hypothetical protein EOP45_23140 [Sphingobacteriaceae bacterium]|nr:MAG: hypothetical protein EOP45_23140 [Sphingobacteriaceae bacterium]
MNEETNADPVEMPSVYTPESLIKDSSVIKLYANNFQAGASIVDSHLIVKLGNQPVCMVHMSLSIMKTLIMQMSQTIKDYEEKTGITVNTVFELQEKLNQSQNGI